MKIAVIGANGQLGSDVAQVFAQNGAQVAKLTHADIEITDADSVAKALGGAGVDMVVNTAAFHNVPKCEDEPETAFKVNGLGAKTVAKWCATHNVYLVHISTDYVFDGAKAAPYIESDCPMPLNVYGNTKLAGDNFVLAEGGKALVMRVSGIYGHEPCRAKGGNNFIQLMLKLARERGKVRVVDDEHLTPTSTLEIARQIYALRQAKPTGIAHATAEGQCSWYEFASAIFEIGNVDVVCEKAQPGEFAITVNRPKYSVLENKTLKDAGLNTFKPWREGLEEYMANL